MGGTGVFGTSPGNFNNLTENDADSSAAQHPDKLVIEVSTQQGDAPSNMGFFV